MAVLSPRRLATEVSQKPLVRDTLAGRRKRSGWLWLLEHTLARDVRVVDQHIREGRFQRGLALIAGLSAVLGGLEVTLQHYRGSYSQRVMYSPVFLSPLVLLAGVWGFFSRRVARTLLPISSLLLLGDGALGFIFHVRGIARKPGGWRIPIFNVIMGPPIFAPLLLGISGFLGVIAAMLRREDDPPRVKAAGLPGQRPAWLGLLPRGITREGVILEHHVREGRFQKVLAAATGVSAILNGVEALYPHYKNDFTYKVQWTPILLAPIVAFAGFGAVASKRIARTLLPLTSALAVLNGAIGAFYHLRGVVRRPGGLKHSFYNTVYGPPLFAPLLFAATGFLGLLASLLRRAD
ncbi:MAG TPA: hypothetical protein VLJ14_15935 [Ktedonobacterales bacterium]|jgi:hypothetical protein|nr:hypothetical protein [Ktedonobacterales bacterium]